MLNIFSGGTLRKLSVANAVYFNKNFINLYIKIKNNKKLIGGSDILFLDGNFKFFKKKI